MSVQDGVQALKELAALLDLKSLEATDAERRLAGKESSDETTDSEADDVLGASAPRADAIDVPTLFKLVRKRDPEVLRFLYRSPWLRPLCIPEIVSDAFIMDLIATMSERVEIKKFAHLWTEHRPVPARPAQANTLVALRDIFNAVVAFEQETLQNGTAGNNNEEDKKEGKNAHDDAEESKDDSGPRRGSTTERTRPAGIIAESVLDALEAKMEFRALCSTCNWFLIIAAGNALPDLCCIEDGVLDFEAFVDLLESCKTIEDHCAKTSSTISPVLVEVLLTHKASDTMHAEWPIQPYHRVTHVQVIALARHWGIDVRAEPHLLWIVLQALQTSLPPDWQVLHPLRSKHPLFRNMDTKEERDDHPGTSYFQDLIKHERQQFVQMRQLRALDADLDPAKAWMQFSFPYKLRADDSTAYRAQVTYYYNFYRGCGHGNAPELEQGYVLRDDNGLLHSKASQSFHVRRNLEKGVFAKKAKSSRSDGIPDTLTFRSWWNDGASRVEGAVRRYMDIYFHVESGNLQVLIEGADKVYTLSHGVGKHGALEACDLFVGAKIKVLGRPTTLMQASSDTVAWNEAQAADLLAVRTKLERELRKYDASTRCSVATRGGAANSRGGHDLRAYMLDIKRLGDSLARFRPKIAQKIVQNTQVMLLR